MAPSSQPYVVEPSGPHKETVILLHGLGDDGVNFGEAILEYFTTSDGRSLQQVFPHARFVFPTAAVRQMSGRMKFAKIRAWFDKFAPITDPPTPPTGMAESAALVLALIREEQEQRRIPADRIILGGLSNGCAMSVSLLLGLDFRLGGCIAMSGYLPTKDVIQAPVTKENREPAVVQATRRQRPFLGLPDSGEACTADKTAQSTPVFLAHGRDDVQVKPDNSEDIAKILTDLGYDVTFKLYSGLGHGIKEGEEIDDIVNFLQKSFSDRIECEFP